MIRFPDNSEFLDESWRSFLLKRENIKFSPVESVFMSNIDGKLADRIALNSIEMGAIWVFLAENHLLISRQWSDDFLEQCAIRLRQRPIDLLRGYRMPSPLLAARKAYENVLGVEDGHPIVISYLTNEENSARKLYQANMRIGMSSLHWLRIQRQKDVLPYLRFTPNEQSLCSCSKRSDIVLRVDHAFWRYAFPPNGPECVCHFEQVSERKMLKTNMRLVDESALPPVSLVAEGYRVNFGERFAANYRPDIVRM